MKRDPHLHPFSWDHHHGLVFARELKIALAEQTNVQTLADRLSIFWRQQLLPHFHAEEKLLFPLALKRGCDTEIDTALAEHKEMTQLHDEIAAAPGAEKVRAKLTRFAELLVQHIRFEENQLLPKLETALASDELASVARALAERETMPHKGVVET